MQEIFSIPFWEFYYRDFDSNKSTFLESVRKYIEDNTKSETKSNYLGYQSPNNLHSVEELRPLFDFIFFSCLSCKEDLNFNTCDMYITSSWVNINSSQNHFNTPHCHDDATFSGVFYLKSSENSGYLNLINKGINPLWNGCKLSSEKNSFTALNAKLPPEEGILYVWPGYLEHFVSTNISEDDERISISFNVICIPKSSQQVETDDVEENS